jgi:hypothetical protein
MTEAFPLLHVEARTVGEDLAVSGYVGDLP